MTYESVLLRYSAVDLLHGLAQTWQGALLPCARAPQIAGQSLTMRLEAACDVSRRCTRRQRESRALHCAVDIVALPVGQPCGVSRALYLQEVSERADQ